MADRRGQHDSRPPGIRIPMQHNAEQPLCTAVVQLLTGKADALARCRSTSFARSVRGEQDEESQKVILGNYIHILLVTPVISARASSARRALFINDSNTTLY